MRHVWWTIRRCRRTFAENFRMSNNQPGADLGSEGIFEIEPDFGEPEYGVFYTTNEIETISGIVRGPMKCTPTDS